MITITTVVFTIIIRFFGKETLGLGEDFYHTESYMSGNPYSSDPDTGFKIGISTNTNTNTNININTNRLEEIRIIT